MWKCQSDSAGSGSGLVVRSFEHVKEALETVQGVTFHD